LAFVAKSTEKPQSG